MKKTKIVATISDLRCDVDFIRELYNSGMNVARLNTAHQSEEDTLRIIENVRKVSEKIALLLDTKGPEIRSRVSGDPIEVNTGDTVYITPNVDVIIENTPSIATSYSNFTSEVPEGASVLIDDGELELIVEKSEGKNLKCRVGNPGKIKNNKSINVPNVSFNLPSLSEKDINYIHFAIRNDLDFIAHSFVRNKEDVMAIQKILDEHNSQIKIISKIENHEGVENIDEILDYTYGIMVARGDLAIEIPYEKIPGIQKMIIGKCIEKRKPVIIATQMLHSMIDNPRPTRAEVSDIANAIYSKADAIMLSGETTYGKYPVEALKTMAKVAEEVEKSRGDYHNANVTVLSSETSAYLAKMAVTTSLKLDADAIIADTTTGRTIRNVAGYRGRKPIFAQCYSKRIVRELALSFGVFANYMESDQGHGFIYASLKSLLDKGMVTEEGKVVILGGNYGPSLGASFIEISSVKNLLSVH